MEENEFNVIDLIKFQETFEDYWIPFMEQFVPSTSMITINTNYSNPDDVVNESLPDAPISEGGETEEIDNPTDTNIFGGVEVNTVLVASETPIGIKSIRVPPPETTGDYTNETQETFITDTYTAYLIPTESFTVSSEIIIPEEERLVEGLEPYQNTFTSERRELIIE